MKKTVNTVSLTASGSTEQYPFDMVSLAIHRGDTCEHYYWSNRTGRRNRKDRLSRIYRAYDLFTRGKVFERPG